MTEHEGHPAEAPERRAWERERYLARIRGLSRAEVVSLGEAVGALVAEGGDAKKLTRGFVLAWYTGPHLSGDQMAEIDRMFVDVVVAMAGALSGVDPADIAGTAERSRGAGAAFLDALFPRRGASELTGVSIRLIRRALAPVDPQPAIVAAWNAGSAIVLRGHLAPDVDAILTAAWRRALGDLPV